jgi:hypothetical protein
MAKIHAETKLNHFKFWTIPDPNRFRITKFVKLKGQFDAAPVEVAVIQPEMIGNPVNKTPYWPDGKMKTVEIKKYNHLLFYSLAVVPEQPTRHVLMHNQLQTNVKKTPWTLEAPNRLLVPASKQPKLKPTDKAPSAKDLEPPENWYHFACYPIKDVDPLTLLELALYDQFDKEFNKQQEEQFRQATFTPKWFCVPVSKQYDKDNRPIPGSRDSEHDLLPGTALPHIVLYEFASKLILKAEVWVRDQFNKEPLLLPVEKASLLGVPTDKVWEDT